MVGKFQFQDQLTLDPHKIDLARGYEQKLQEQGRSLIAILYMLLRNVKLYSLDNEIFFKPLEQIKSCINTIISMDGTLNLQVVGESFYLNNMLIKIDVNSLDNVRYIQMEFQRRNVGGFLLHQPVTAPEIINFIYIFSQESDEEVKEHGVSRKKLAALKLRRFEKIKEILKEQITSESLERQVDRKRYTLTVYARAIYFMRKYLIGLRGEGYRIPIGKAGRFVQDFVDICHGSQSHFLGLTTLKSGDEYLCFHSVNVCLLSIVFGVELGLPKTHLRDLGMAALFHDIGKVDIDEEIFMKRGKLALEESRQVQKSPIYSVKKILQTNLLNKLTIHRIITAFEHKTDFGTPIHDLKGNISFIVPKEDLGAYSKIIAIADCYDALTSNRPFREAYGPDIALSLMWTELKHRFDPDYLKIFMNVMKIPAVKVLSGKGQKVIIF